MTSVFARIIARYISGAMMAYGFIGAEMAETMATDPDIILAIGAALGIIAEGAYALATKKGWVR